jgi:hypothetical protein
MDLAMFDIFSGAAPDKDAMWVEAVSGLANAQRRMKEIAEKSPGQYFVFSQGSSSVVAQTDTRKSASPPSEEKQEGAV